MAKIQIYARVRPTVNSRHRYEGLETLPNNHLQIKIGETEDTTQRMFSKAPGSKHVFKFNQVFNEEANQEEVYSAVAEHMVDTFLVGYNGTIFAYGQTSSGKTYTIEGSGRKYTERGLIPRVLSQIYNALERRTEEEEISVHVSYMEIYQDTGYDLLNPGMRPGALMVTLPKVQIAEGANGEVVVRNLSTHLAATEEVAQSLLFQGSTCRRVAETSMNQCSSRSHSIFTIMLTVRAPGSEVITRSKLNLVDLAGSERVAKTGADGRILQEAKHINLSLHHLEHVIVALQQQARRSSTSRGGSGTPERYSPSPTHSRSAMSVRKNTRGLSGNSQYGSPRPATRSGGYIPYRNCMLTMVLRDSLGGNCLTAMIATISAEEVNIWESISTCRFSQRVACIANRARRNEELDDKVIIKRLKQRIAELEKEVSQLSQEAVSAGSRDIQQLKAPDDTALTDSDRHFCHKVLYDFFHGKVENPVSAGIDTASKFQECLHVLRDIVLHALSINKSSASASPGQKVNPVEELSNRVKASIRDHSPSTVLSSTPTTSASTQISENVPAKQSRENVLQSSHRKSKKLQTTTPTSNSRLSSGFGSLQDEDGTLYESGYYPDLHKQSVSHHHKQTSPRFPQQGSYDSSGKNPHFTSQPHWSAPTPLLPPDKIQQSDPFPANQPSPKTFSSPLQAVEQSATSLREQTSPQAFSPQSPSEWTSPQAFSPRSPRERTWQQAFSPQSPRERTSSHSQKAFSPQSLRQHLPTSPISPLSPRQYQALQQQAHLQKKLTAEVQLMNLRVHEEELRGHLSQVGEQLATQHLRVLKTQPGQAIPEQICAERIAEQQLRIKQAKLHQKLLDVQYQVKTLERQQSDGTDHVEKENISSPTQRTPNEAAKHEMKQTKVQQQIEKLRISQMEKQLELKEAATKRKLLALKQQLQNSRIASPPSEMTSPQYVFNKPPATAPVVTPAKTEQNSCIPKSESDRLAISVDGKWHTISLRRKDESRRPIQHTPPQKSDETLRKAQSQSSSTTQSTVGYVHPTTENITSQSLQTHRQAEFSRRLPSSRPNETSQTQATRLDEHSTNSTNMDKPLFSTLHQTPQDICVQIDHPQKHKTVANQQSNTPEKASGDIIHAEPRQNSVNVNSESKARRLTLPEEIKETEYMTALQRQRARVSRIRRCIVAATVIQRAWKIYKHKKT